ncbi:MAG: hypothetical protein ACRD8O_16920 [Bryobacteraceae bacterium]
MNYFNYFTEVEDHFRLARGTGLFLLSPLDWALIESWRSSGVPLEAVLRGIDAAFEKWRAKRTRTQMVNSLAFCSQAVLTEAELMAANVPASPKRGAVAPFPLDDLRQYLTANGSAVKTAGFEDIAATLEKLAAEAELHYYNLEQLEQRLSALEEKLMGALKSRCADEDLLAIRRDLDAQLRPYRSKMTAPQLAMLEKQYLERKLLEQAALPRLSLFYMK